MEDSSSRGVTPLQGALLGLVGIRPMSGYDLTGIFDRTLANVWSAKHSRIYPELARLRDAGLVFVRAAGGRGRKEYTLTETGRDELRRWLLGSPPERRGGRNEALLRSFFLGWLSREDAVAFLREEEAYHAGRLAEYEEEAARGPFDSHAGYSGELPLEAGIRYEQTMVEWARWAAERVEEIGRESGWGREHAELSATRVLGSG